MKREKKIFDIKKESTITFAELTSWYTNLKDIKALRSFNRINIVLENWNRVFGQTIIGDIQQIDIQEYQMKRAEEGRSAATIDMEISVIKTMVTKGFDNDKILGHTLKAFRTIKRKLKKGSNARKRTITHDEYIRLCAAAPPHLEAVIIMALNTGMRLGEIRLLKWSHIDRENMFIRLPKDITKEGREKNIPINHHVKSVLEKIPRALRHEFVFTYRGRNIQHKNGLKKAFMTACRKAKIVYGRDTTNGVIFHDLRRSTKTFMVEAGVNEVYRNVLLGHALPGMDAHYIAPPDKMLRKAMDLYTNWIDTEFVNSDYSSDQKREAGN